MASIPARRIIDRMKRLAIVIAVLLTLPSFAQKRRSVGTPEVDADPITIVCKGTVTDAATGLPIAFAEITTDRGIHGATPRSGKFSFKVVTKLGSVSVTAGRTGYQSSTIKVTAAGTNELNFRLESRPTATLKKSDGTTVALDDDSVKFGYIVPFINYQTMTGSDFCMTDGTRSKIPIAQMARITGLGMSVPSSCCQRSGQRVLLELRDTTLQDATFIDSCYGYSVDLIGREHATGDVLYVPFGDVAEIVFP